MQYLIVYLVVGVCFETYDFVIWIVWRLRRPHERSRAYSPRAALSPLRVSTQHYLLD